MPAAVIGSTGVSAIAGAATAVNIRASGREVTQ